MEESAGEEPHLTDEPPIIKRHTIFKPRITKPNFILSVLVNALRLLALLILLVGLAGAGAVIGIAKGYMETAPVLDLTLLDAQDQTSFLYDSTGELITDYKGTENRVMVNITMIPEKLRNAFVAVEDARFYTHNGIDLKRIVGSFVQNFISGSQQGGSTITQQLIKNTVLSSEQSYKRKIQEAYLAMQLETKYSKLQILEYYLNTIYLGENYYGVQVAAEGYFGKSDLSQLTLRECAMLAGLTSNPYYYNPRRNFYTRTSETIDYAAITNDRTDYVLRCMYENEFITREEYESALNTTTAQVLTSASSTADSMYPYPHYVEYAVQEVVDCFLKLEGLEDNAENRAKMENKLRTGGYHVTLAIDPEIQTIVEETLENWTKYPSLRDPSDKVYRTRKSDGTYDEIIQPQAAAVVMDYRTGEVKAIVGARTHPTVKKSLNRAVNMKMPIGSTIKPIAVYAPAIELGYSPASVAYNMPVPIKGYTSGGKDTWPKNFDSGYAGPETLRKAITYSHNVAAAQVLMNMVGVDRSVDFLLRMGIDRDHIDATPYGLSLGSSGITPYQLTVAYSVLANGGVYQTPVTFLGISDSNGNVIYDSHAQQERRQVFRPATAWLVVDMMKDVIKSGTGTAAKISGQTTAGKTGTNSDQRGITFCGMTGWYVSALWIGHDNYKPLSSKSTGGRSATPLWQSYMSQIHKKKNLSNRDIIEAEPEEVGLVKVTTCAVSGQLATDACKNDNMGYGVVTDWWYKDSVPTVSCQMHQSITLCWDSKMPATEYCPNTYVGGVAVIPQGHPLYEAAIDPEYSQVVAQYLGTGASMSYCTLHNGYSLTQEQESSLITHARELLQSAYTYLEWMDPEADAYWNLQNAISYLEGLLMSDASDGEIRSALTMLTQAMAETYD